MDSRELVAQFASQSCTRTIFEKNINSLIPKALHQILIGAISAWFMHDKSKLFFVRNLMHISDGI